MVELFNLGLTKPACPSVPCGPPASSESCVTPSPAGAPTGPGPLASVPTGAGSV